MPKKIKVWFDGEADFLEVRLDGGPGYMKATANDCVMERVSPEGEIIGFSILGVSNFRKEKPSEIEL